MSISISICYLAFKESLEPLNCRKIFVSARVPDIVYTILISTYLFGFSTSQAGSPWLCYLGSSLYTCYRRDYRMPVHQKIMHAAPLFLDEQPYIQPYCYMTSPDFVLYHVTTMSRNPGPAYGDQLMYRVKMCVPNFAYFSSLIRLPERIVWQSLYNIKNASIFLRSKLETDRYLYRW